MPTAKGHNARLSPALLYYLAHARPRPIAPRDDRGGRTGLIEAFSLKHAQLADALAELRRLWAEDWFVSARRERASGEGLVQSQPVHAQAKPAPASFGSRRSECRPSP